MEGGNSVSRHYLFSTAGDNTKVCTGEKVLTALPSLRFPVRAMVVTDPHGQINTAKHSGHTTALGRSPAVGRNW